VDGKGPVLDGKDDVSEADHPVIKNEMLELASGCEEVANNIEDHLTGG
jgi:hypothetical protein